MGKAFHTNEATKNVILIIFRFNDFMAVNSRRETQNKYKKKVI